MEDELPDDELPLLEDDAKVPLESDSLLAERPGGAAGRGGNEEEEALFGSALEEEKTPDSPYEEEPKQSLEREKKKKPKPLKVITITTCVPLLSKTSMEVLSGDRSSMPD